MWRLLKSELSYKKLFYFFAIAIPVVMLAYKGMAMSEWHNEKLINRLLAGMIAGIIILITGEAYSYDDNKRLRNTTRFLSLMPVTITQQFLIRLITGIPLLTVILTGICSSYLYLVREYTGGGYWICLIFGCLVITGQLLSYILFDLASYRSTNSFILTNPAIQFPVLIMPPLGFLIARIASPQFQAYSFSLTETALAALAVAVLSFIGLYVFHHRKSYLR